MKQLKLESFFNIKIKHNDKNKKCFIYDPQNCRAFFSASPDDTDIFITKKLEINLYYRHRTPIDINIPDINTNYSVPLLKSNLQKAIRRCNTSVAIQTTLAILQKNPLELLRRLPIIYIEDVCLMDSYPIIVWLMMADKEYSLTNTDYDIILNIVKSLCECKEYYESEPFEKDPGYSREMLEKYENSEGPCVLRDSLISIYIRSNYGGMKGDIELLKSSIGYYIKNPKKIVKTKYNTIDYENIEKNIKLLDESIDFHPFPQMLNYLSKHTNLNKSTIKKCIWFVESGYNSRKSLTIELSNKYKESIEWNKIKEHISSIRHKMLKSFISE